MKRRGFTIVEMLMVVAVIAVLTGIVTTAASSAMRSAREKRADAMLAALQAAITTYQAQDPNGKWPAPIETLAQSTSSRVLDESEAQRVFQIIVQKSTGQSGAMMPLIDPTGLFVAPSGVRDGKGTGMSFTDARNGSDRRRKLPVSQMVFGYQGKLTGRFHRYNIVYHAQTDSVTVSKCCHECLTTTGCKHAKGSDNPCPICHLNE